MIREEIRAATVAAMKARDGPRLAALRLVQAAIKNRDIEARTGEAPADDDALVIEVLGRMAEQRRESIAIYAAGNRPDLAAREAAELQIIESFLPARLSEAEARDAIAALVREAGATSAKDMGRVMTLVKARLAGRLDMAEASRLVKAALA
ncbi:GatB/YqeY domain-containing protein [Thermaurantiacus sp.]